MRKTFFLFLSFFCVTQMAFGQHRVTVILDSIPQTHQEDPIYITGEFNMWVPAEDAYQMQKNEHGKPEIVIENNLPGLFEFKFNRGDWATLECDENGRLMGAHVADIHSDTTLHASVHFWRDDFPESTASPQVHVMAENFPMPQLGRERKIWIYLPEDYETSAKRYPVLYMHDGQDLFDEATSLGRTGNVEWGVDEAVDAAHRQMIVVGIERHPDNSVRMGEYFFHPNEEYPEVEGENYLEFIVNTLKPHVDEQFRTLPGRAFTAIAGASMGGLIACYAGIHYPHIFGFAGCLSPSIWLDHGNIEHEINRITDPEKYDGQYYYFYAGDYEYRRTPEGSIVEMAQNVLDISNSLQENANVDITINITPGGDHGPWHWRKAFPAYYNWLLQSMANE